MHFSLSINQRIGQSEMKTFKDCNNSSNNKKYKQRASSHGTNIRSTNKFLEFHVAYIILERRCLCAATKGKWETEGKKKRKETKSCVIIGVFQEAL